MYDPSLIPDHVSLLLSLIKSYLQSLIKSYHPLV